MDADVCELSVLFLCTSVKTYTRKDLPDFICVATFQGCEWYLKLHLEQIRGSHL